VHLVAFITIIQHDARSPERQTGRVFNLLAPELFFFILAHSVYKI